MSSFNIFILTVLLVNSVLARSICDPDDEDCTKCGVKEAYSLFVTGVDNLVDTSDPVSLGLIKANLPTVKYELHDAKLKGLKKCDLTKMTVDKEKSSFVFHLNCDSLEVNADYTLIGNIGDMYVEGEGKLKVKLEDYLLKFNGVYEINTGKDEKQHVHIKNYFIDVDSNGNVLFDFQNLFDGDKEKTEGINNYLNKNWKAMDKALRAPPLYSFMDIFIDNLNDFLSVYPVEQIFPEQVKN